MTTEAAKKIKAKRARRPVYLMVRRLVDPATGESVGALVPAHPIDQRLLKERRFNVGREIRAELKQSRNPAFHRLVHAVGALLVDHVDGFDTMTSHDALKRVQREAAVHCEQVEVDLGPMGKALVLQPRSISFDEMDEGEFGELFRGITDYIDRHYISGLTDAVRGEYLLMAGEQRRTA
ncbi:hypothetical protein [Stenotrophomonas tumulicola]|uniref:Uncharacterized protein n=1 Tax=Stenotrophomonas tumulicola TaxID=1685415 RepID=A0A7W3IG72_9GAMM|nr:hypothetical protein [Stenotrophomonas tumulicola]MBA8680497.1 hypothetical protein [Stenotrophomonas tumulicola]